MRSQILCKQTKTLKIKIDTLKQTPDIGHTVTTPFDGFDPIVQSLDKAAAETFDKVVDLLIATGQECATALPGQCAAQYG